MTTDSSTRKINSLKRHFYIRSTILAGLVAAVVIFATLIAYKIPWIYDMTAGKIFTLSEQTKQVVSSLKSQVEIFAVYPKGGADPLLSSLLAEYEKAGEMLSIEYIDAERDPARLASFDPGVNSVNNGTIIVRANGKTKFLYSSDMFQPTQDGNGFWGESQITGAIRYVTADVMPVIYFLEGHDEASTSTTLSRVRSTLEFNVYNVKTLSLIKSGGVPGDAALVVVSSPKRDLSEDEFAMFSDYMQKGGKALFLVDVINTNTLVLKNFNQVLHTYGIDITNNLVVEEDPYSHVSNNNLYLIPGYAYHTITQVLAESKRYVVLPIVLGLHTLDYDTTLITLEPLLASSPRSWMRTDMSSTSTSKTETDIQGPVPLAYAATKTDSSFSNMVSRLVVIGNSTFIYNENIESYANRDFFMNCVNWLSGGRGENSIPPRIIGADKFIVRGDNFTRLLIISLVVMPLIPFICAFIIWYFRRNQ
jgi:ABC-2 type transport system permease protein